MAYAQRTFRTVAGARADALVRGPAEHTSGVDGITVAIAV
jgi:hypothetical protein